LLNQVNPQAVLQRGYAIIRGQNGKILRETPKIGDKLHIETARAEIAVTVDKISS
jgi:exonuclease VII large subunit